MGDFHFYSGTIQLGAQPLRMLLGGKLSEVLEDEPEVVARVFAAFGSPFRVRLLRALLEGQRTSQELQAELAIGPVGQLYHLKDSNATFFLAIRASTTQSPASRDSLTMRPSFRKTMRSAYAAIRESWRDHEHGLSLIGELLQDAGDLVRAARVEVARRLVRENRHCAAS